jgi:predicted nucleotidyltransferase
LLAYIRINGYDTINEERKVTDKDYQAVQELKRELSKKLSIVDLKIFGSRARGKGREFSDLDVFIEVEYVNSKIKKEIYDISWEIGFKHDIFISPLIFSRYDIESSPLKASPIVKNIMEDGITV